MNNIHLPSYIRGIVATLLSIIFMMYAAFIFMKYGEKGLGWFGVGMFVVIYASILLDGLLADWGERYKS